MRFRMLGQRFVLLIPIVALCSAVRPGVLAMSPPGQVGEGTISQSESIPEVPDVMTLLTPDQARAYLSGVAAVEIALTSGESLAEFLLRNGIGEFEIDWHSIDGGAGSTSIGGSFLVNGTVGQPDIGQASAGDFQMQAGFWAVTTVGALFRDDFESGDTSGWSSTVGR